MNHQNGAAPSGGTQVLFAIAQSPEGLLFQTKLPPRELLRLLIGVVEDVREQALLDVQKHEEPRVQVVQAVPGVKLS